MHITRRTKIFLWIFGSLAWASLAGIYFMDLDTFKGQKISFLSEENVTLRGHYYSGDKSVGLMFLEGFGSNQIAMKNLVSEFLDWDLHIFTFDFSGPINSSRFLDQT